MNPNLVTVSVVIPAYNAEAHIGAAVASVFKQTFKDLEVIVVDDGSRDGTAQVVKTRFPQAVCVSKPNGGASSARNVGCRMARGEFIAFLDADDEWHPDKLAAQVALMRAYPLSDLSRVAVRETPFPQPLPSLLPKSGALPEHSCFDRLAQGFEFPFFATSAVMVRRSAYDAVGGFDEKLPIAEDIDFFLKVMARRPCVPTTTQHGLFKRPIQGSLGDDSEAGYVRLLEVYERFLAQHPASQREMGHVFVRKVLSQLLARLAASQYRNGRAGPALQAALRSLTTLPNVLALRVVALLVFKPRRAAP